MDKKDKKYPEPIVGALIIDNDNKIFLAKSHKWKGKYVIPGGHIELGETVEEATKREVKEETGMDVKLLDCLGINEGINNEDFHEKKHFVFIEMLCKFDGDKNSIKLNDEFDKKFLWIDLEDAKNFDIAPSTKLILDLYSKYKESHESLNNWKRCAADFENYKKRQAENRKDLIAYSNANLIMQLLPVLDNFHASTDHVPEDQKKSAWVTGIMHIQKQLEKVLEDNGASEIVVKEGDKFDPEIHEAISQNAKETNINTKKTNQVKKVLQKGYKINSKVIRAARVIVE